MLTEPKASGGADPRTLVDESLVKELNDNGFIKSVASK
jgi:hypothetical protein